ncbi:uncharacterized protein LOC112345664 isoform X2 [Selaginella moellendorffii]|uniref:uncharacterized protein LOC112345664 isoform X2 n=1 Tax=Selaginella moellendorffii TaxID=88036 RepID=UPI000D1CC879|nr:uncharacterized protein LOC112345664 isoform X2 [Selaginella moellendorffii]|eukprot:XP_024528674.1 uncharacterized protein LOC112345664 isoform X2 [Selaginella moellendorffii]
MWPFVAGVFSCARAVPPTFRLARPSRAFPEALRSASRRRLGGDTSIHRKFAAAALQSATASNEKHDCKVLPGFTRRKEKKEGCRMSITSSPFACHGLSTSSSSKGFQDCDHSVLSPKRPPARFHYGSLAFIL